MISFMNALSLEKEGGECFESLHGGLFLPARFRCPARFCRRFDPLGEASDKRGQSLPVCLPDGHDVIDVDIFKRVSS